MCCYVSLCMCTLVVRLGRMYIRTSIVCSPVDNIGGEAGQDMVQLEELKLAGNNLSSAEAYLNKFITSLPV